MSVTNISTSSYIICRAVHVQCAFQTVKSANPSMCHFCACRVRRENLTTPREKRARTRLPLQAQKLHTDGGGASGGFGTLHRSLRGGGHTARQLPLPFSQIHLHATPSPERVDFATTRLATPITVSLPNSTREDRAQTLEHWIFRWCFEAKTSRDFGIRDPHLEMSRLRI